MCVCGCVCVCVCVCVFMCVCVYVMGSSPRSCTFTSAKSCRNLSDLQRSTFKIAGAAQLHPLSEIEPKSPTVLVGKRRPSGKVFVPAQELSYIV